jgi:hypothetical protein
MSHPSMDRIRRVSELENRNQKRDADIEDVAEIVAAMRATVPLSPDSPATASLLLPRSWKPQRFHVAQSAAFASQARHRAIEAGRRSGKSEGRKREIAIAALDPSWPLEDRFLVVGAPTQQQSMRLYWRSLLRLIPKRFVLDIRKTDCEIELVNGALIRVVGMDKPQRAEGDPIDGLWLDEFADMRLGRSVIDDHLGPSLSTPDRPPGRITVYGTPDMRTGAHFIDLCDRWRERSEAGDGAFGYWHWSARGIVSDDEWSEKQRTLDPASFAVEYEARRVSTGNRAYYTFAREQHVRPNLRLMPTRPVIVCCDWNWDPATASLVQEQTTLDYPGRSDLPREFTAVLGEVMLRSSNTPSVARSVLAWLGERKHVGTVYVEGDPAGGAQGSARVEGSDIELVRKCLSPTLGDRLSMRFAAAAPKVVARINAMNGRLLNALGEVRLIVDSACVAMIRDLEQVHLVEGGHHVEIAKPTSGAGKLLSHLSDGLGYYIARQWPIRGPVTITTEDR